MSPTRSADTSDQRIIDINVSDEMQTSFLEYAYSVIYSRALPDARDGLKPVQRRILYQMAQMGLTPDKGHVKSSRVVGEVMGKLHPHGDAAIYDALVRMAQDFTLRLPLIDGHGNFGSLDAGPAAPRYTEARLAPAALVMTADLDANTVDFVPNYDNRLTQPDVLPAALPNLLVNGASGIAVGMATNMPPHNLGEVVGAARHLINNPDAELDALLQFVPGPDLPGGGKIVGLEGIRQAYETGRGTFRTRATTSIERISPRRWGIVVTELPYLVGPERLIERIKDAVQAKKLQGISSVADLTDLAHGLRIEIGVKSGFNPEAVLAELYRHTPLEDSFGINNVALVNGEPRTLGLRELLKVYVEHRITVVRRRTQHHLGRCEDRLHLVEGLLIAILDIDEVIEVIRSSDDAEAARKRLMIISDLSQKQAEYILELRLRRLTKFSRIELETEKNQLQSDIEKLQAILADDAKLRQVVSEELGQVAEDHGTPRRTVLLESDAAIVSSKHDKPSLKIADDPCWILLSGTGLIARTTDESTPSRSGKRSPHDVVTHALLSTARGEIGAVTNTGRLIKFNAVDIPALPPTQAAPSLAGGVALSDLVAVGQKERIVGIVTLDAEEEPITLGTRNGVVKRVRPDWPARADEWEIISLKDDDEVVGVSHAGDPNELIFITHNAQLLRFPANSVRPQGRSGGGITGIRLQPNDEVISFTVRAPEDCAHVVTIAGSGDSLAGTEPGSAKVTPLDTFPARGRATGGVRAHRFLKGEERLNLAGVTPDYPRAINAQGKAVELPEVDDRRDGSGNPLKTPVLSIG